MPARDPSPVHLTYLDYGMLPEDGQRHEILDGRHVVTPAPGLEHQSVLLALGSQLRAQVDERGRGRVFIAPTDLQLSDVDVLQPDLMVVGRDRFEVLTPARVVGVPDLVVEILSPSTEARDRGAKRDRYGWAGVPEYWIVSLVERSVEQCVLEAPGTWRVAGTHRRAFAAAVLEDVRVDVPRLFSR